MSKEKPKRITAENYLKYYYDIPYEGTTSAGKPLRKLKDITCPYRGIKIIPSDMIKGFEKNLAKCKTSADAVKLLSAYQKNMLPVEKSIYAIFKDFGCQLLTNLLELLSVTSCQYQPVTILCEFPRATKSYTTRRTCYQHDLIHINQMFIYIILRTNIRKIKQNKWIVDNGADVTGKKLSHMKYSSKRSDFLRFYLYLCHVIDDFACL